VMQSFKRVKNYFTDSLLYQENGKVVKEPLPDDIDNEADSKSRDNPVTTFDEESIVAYFNDPDCNNSAEYNGEWVHNENVHFNYSLYFDDVSCHVDMSSLPMPLPMLTACVRVEDKDGSIFIVPSAKKYQSPIINGRA